MLHRGAAPAPGFPLLLYFPDDGQDRTSRGGDGDAKAHGDRLAPPSGRATGRGQPAFRKCLVFIPGGKCIVMTVFIEYFVVDSILMGLVISLCGCLTATPGPARAPFGLVTVGYRVCSVPSKCVCANRPSWVHRAHFGCFRNSWYRLTDDVQRRESRPLADVTGLPTWPRAGSFINT